jgi:hydroxypyruvate isomerase
MTQVANDATAKWQVVRLTRLFVDDDGRFITTDIADRAIRCIADAHGSEPYDAGMIRWSAHLSMLFTELPPLERPAAAAAAGFALVESWWPPAEDLDAWVDAIHAAGVGVSCLNADGGDIAAGERGFCNLAERERDTFAAVSGALSLAERVDCPAVNVLPGLLVDDRTREAQLDHALAIYRECGRLAAASGRTIVIEPINAIDVPAYLLPTPTKVADFLGQVDHPNVGMLFDAYHCARGGGDPVAEATKFSATIGHVQYADSPGRGAPGTGQIDLAAFVSALADAGYHGAIGLEYNPAGPTEPTLGFTRREPGSPAGHQMR